MDLALISKNVADKIAVPQKDNKREMKVWTPKEVKQFMSVTKDYYSNNALSKLYLNQGYFVAFHLALFTGMRQGEILGLRWRDIDFEKATLQIKQTLSHDGKTLMVGAKTKSSIRTIKLASGTIVVLKKHKVYVAAQKLQYGLNYVDKDLVICSPKGIQLNPSNLLRSFKKMVKISCTPMIRFHDLRHTHATVLLSNGTNVKVVSERLGHSSVKVTLETYYHVLPIMQEEAAKQIEDLLSS